MGKRKIFSDDENEEDEANELIKSIEKSLAAIEKGYLFLFRVYQVQKNQ